VSKLYFFYLILIIFIIVFIFFKNNNILTISKHNYSKNFSISGFDISYGVDVNSSESIFIPDFKLGYIFKIEKNLKDVSVLDLKKEKLEPISIFEKIISLTFFNKIIKKRGYFNRIHDIYFDHLDNMYVVDMGLGHNRGEGILYIFDNNLNLIKKIGENSHYKKGLISPAMSSADKKYIYISEWGASKIMIYDNKFNYYGWLGTYDEITDKIKSDYWTKEKQILDISLNRPHAVKFDKYNNIYIADSNNNRIIKLSENFSIQGFIGKSYNTNNAIIGWEKESFKTSKGNNLGEFDTPVGMEIYNDNIYIADCFNDRIVKYTLEGLPIGILSINKENNHYYWSKNNDEKIDINNPYAIIIFDNSLYIADKKNFKIQVISLKEID
jgi:hypothetical protein|tara:strand:- start:529 stop:1677 length:1149 start_codon:yes stop_codon:yes gene_type:complete